MASRLRADNTPDDFTLAHFDHNLTYDKVNVAPFIKAATALVRGNGGDLKLFGSPWSMPSWMKLNNAPQGQCPRPNSMKPDSPNGSYLQAWADYISAWLSAYAAYGVYFYAITPQNEPSQQNGGGCCCYDPAHYTAFVGQYLGPTMRKDHPNISIWVWDYSECSPCLLPMWYAL